jgi:hypothetical protein
MGARLVETTSGSHYRLAAHVGAAWSLIRIPRVKYAYDHQRAGDHQSDLDARKQMHEENQERQQRNVEDIKLHLVMTHQELSHSAAPPIS